MKKNQKSKLGRLLLCVIILYSIYILQANVVLAVSPTVTPKLSPTSSASSSASITPTSEDEKVQEIRDAIKEKLTQIKDKIEKKAYVGTILEITDSTLTLSNPHGKQRVRILPETIIAGLNKASASLKDLAVEDKVIAMGQVDANGTLEAKRVVAVPTPKVPPVKRIVFLGTITEVDSKNSTLNLTNIKNLDQSLLIKIDKNTGLINGADQKVVLKFKDFAQNQRILLIYLEPASGKTAVAKTIYKLP